MCSPFTITTVRLDQINIFGSIHWENTRKNTIISLSDIQVHIAGCHDVCIFEWQISTSQILPCLVQG